MINEDIIFLRLKYDLSMVSDDWLQKHPKWIARVIEDNPDQYMIKNSIILEMLRDRRRE